MAEKVKILIVDDSALVRKIFSDIISQDPSLEVVGTAQNGKIALNKIEKFLPDIVTLDLEMPEIDGFGVLREMIKKEYNAKVIMISGLTNEGATTTLKALEMGAVDFIPKPSGRSNDLKELSETIINKIHGAAKVDSKKVIHKAKRIISEPTKIKKIDSIQILPKKIIAIGTSTGGPNALKDIFTDNSLPEDSAYLIVQHMPKEFTGPFADRLNQVSKIRVKEAIDNEGIYAGWAYLAPGDAHLEIDFKHKKPFTKISRTGKVSGHQPSINVLFNSVAKNCAKYSIAVIMTGMGRDGADGMKLIRMGGGRTIAQDKESSVVFGMNKEAIDVGGVEKIVPLKDIPFAINTFNK